MLRFSLRTVFSQRPISPAALSHAQPSVFLSSTPTKMSQTRPNMNAVLVHAYGGPEALSFESVPVPNITDDQVLVKTHAIGVNFIDTYMRSGLYPSPSFPVRLGREAVGVVEEVGAGVTHIKVGDRVGFVGATGAYAEYTTVPASSVVSIPAAIPDDTAVASLLQGMTAHALATDTFPIQAGDSVLIHAGAGGVGGLLVQIAKMLGATVFTTVSTDEKAELARSYGADHVIMYTREPFEKRILELTHGAGVKVVYDSVGKSTYMQSIEALATRGYLVLFGNASGPVPPIDPFLLSKKSLYVTRAVLGHYIATRQDLDRRSADIFRWVESGKLSIRVGARFPLGKAREAHEALQGRETTGKVILVPESH